MTTSRTIRADAARNRQMVLEAAARVFAGESEPSVRAIAHEAGVGVGTLYRHFPTRESLVDAVYRDQVERLTAGARELLAKYPPAEAMRRWMNLFADWVATKRGMLQTLLAMIDAGSIPHAATRDTLLATVAAVLEAGIAAGEIRPDASADDVIASLLGILTVAGASDQKTQAGRLLDLLMDGLRPRP